MTSHSTRPPRRSTTRHESRDVRADREDPPREALADAFATPERKRRYVARLFDTIADRYDFITRLLSYGRDQRWKARVIELAAIRPGERALDLACGTGDLAFAAAALRARVVGLDLAPRMLQLARERASRAGRAVLVKPLTPREGRATGPARVADAAASTDGAGGIEAARGEGLHAQRPVTFVVGDMTALPIPDASFDVVTTGYGLRNVPVLDEAIREIARVLVPGGRLVSLDFNRPRQPLLRAAYLAYLTIVGSTVGWLLHGDPDTYRYIPASIRRYPGADAVVQRLLDAGFAEARWQRVLGGLMAIHVARKGGP